MRDTQRRRQGWGGHSCSVSVLSPFSMHPKCFTCFSPSGKPEPPSWPLGHLKALSWPHSHHCQAGEFWKNKAVRSLPGNTHPSCTKNVPEGPQRDTPTDAHTPSPPPPPQAGAGTLAAIIQAKSKLSVHFLRAENREKPLWGLEMGRGPLHRVRKWGWRL